MNQQAISDRSAELIMRYYDNDYMPFLSSFADDALWYGPAEGQFIRGREVMIRAWLAEEHDLRFTMGNLKAVHISAHPSTCMICQFFSGCCFAGANAGKKMRTATCKESRASSSAISPIPMASMKTI